MKTSQITLAILILFTSANAATSSKKLQKKSYDSETMAKFKQGDSAWAVYLAVDKPGAQSLRNAESDIKGLKIPTAMGELSCDHGAAEALHIPDDKDLQYVAVYFATEADAKQFSSTLKKTTRGIAKVTIYCMD